MSFTTNVKNEICLTQFSTIENIAELSGFIRGSYKNDVEKLELSCENAKVAKRLYLLIKSIYGVDVLLEQRKMANFSKKKIYVITSFSKTKQILEDLSVIDSNNHLIETPKDYLLGSIEEIKAYLRGSFLARGSINDPKTSQYHLEMLYDNKYEAVFVQRLLNQFELNSKIIMRDIKYMVYIKESDKISDFLRIVNANQAVLYYENIRIYKDQKNKTNRLNNCEQANIDKVIETCNNQIQDINTISSKLGLDFLDDKIKEACLYRLKYPEASLLELSKIISVENNTNITKSGLNHRFRKIREIASKLKDN